MRTTVGAGSLLALGTAVPAACGGAGASSSSASPSTSDAALHTASSGLGTIVVAADGSEPSGEGVGGDLGTITRDDGTQQVTLDGAPLYLFSGDHGPGDVAGEGVDHLWWVVGPDGSKITRSPAPAPDFSY